MDQNSNLYPDLVSEEESKKLMDSIQNKDRIEIMNSKLETLKKDEKRYKKYMRRWKNASTGLRITGVVLVGVTGLVSGIILLPGLAIPLIVPGILAISGVIEGTLSEGLNMGICHKRINHLNKKSSLITSYINKLFYYTHKASSDGIITLEEIKGFHQILDEYNAIENGMSEVGLESIDKKLLKKAQMEADKEYNEISLKKEKERILSLRLNGP